MATGKDLVVKMTINSADFDNGLKNAKASMNKFQNETINVSKLFKSAMSGMVKAFGTLGLAVGGAELFKSFIGSTQTIGDKWNNTMVAAKTSFQVFEQAVVLGNGNILSNFKQSIDAAREFAAAMDAYGSAQISNKYARMKYVTPFNEAMTKYRDMKSKRDTAGMAFAAGDMKRYLEAYSENSAQLMKTSMEAVTKKLEAYTGGFVNSGNVNKYLDQLYLEIVNGVFPPILQDFRNLETERKKGDYFYNQAKEAMSEKYGEGWQREAQAMNALANINDETLKEMLGVLQTYDQVRNEINSMRRTMNKALKGEATTTVSNPNLTSGGIETSSTPTMTQDQIIEYIEEGVRNWIQARDKEKDLLVVNLEIPAEDIIEEDTEILMEKVKKVRDEMEMLAYNTQMAFSAVGSLSQAFGYLGQISDGTLGDVFQGLGNVIAQIASTISAMMALAGAETVEGIVDVFANTEGGVVTKLAVSAAALAGILSIIASAKSSFAGSFAEGGVVGGSSYTGDRLWARVNSGEMIIPYDEWHNASQPRQQNVHFVIEGQDLRGVLDNNDKIQNL